MFVSLNIHPLLVFLNYFIYLLKDISEFTGNFIYFFLFLEKQQQQQHEKLKIEFEGLGILPEQYIEKNAENLEVITNENFKKYLNSKLDSKFKNKKNMKINYNQLQFYLFNRITKKITNITMKDEILLNDILQSNNSFQLITNTDSF